MATILTVIAGILFFVAGWISSSGRMYKFEGIVIKPLLRTTLWVMVAITAGIITIWQKNVENTDQEKKLALADSFRKVQFDNSLKTIADKSDSNYRNTFDAIAEKLGEYGFKLDSTNKLVRDSAKTKVISAVKPTFTLFGALAEASVRPHAIRLSPELIGVDAPIKNVYFTISFFRTKVDKSLVYLGTTQTIKWSNLPIGLKRDIASYHLAFDSTDIGMSMHLEGLLIGHNKDSIKLDEVCVYVYATKNVKGILAPYDDRVKEMSSSVSRITLY